MHSKSVLVDGQVLIVGSQNFHYSAYGPGGGLSEFSFAVEDPRAAEEYQRIFNYEWAVAERP